MNILTSEWTIGIGSSIIASFLIGLFWNLKRNKEYNQKILRANSEILNAAKSIIVDNTRFSYESAKAMIFSTARKLKLNLNDIYNVEELCQDLITDIMNNSFLTSDRKVELTQLVSSISNEPEVHDYRNRQNSLEMKRDKAFRIFALAQAILLSGFGLYVAIDSYVGYFKDQQNTRYELDRPDWIIWVTLVFSIPLISYTIVYLATERRKRRSNLYSENYKVGRK